MRLWPAMHASWTSFFHAKRKVWLNLLLASTLLACAEPAPKPIEPATPRFMLGEPFAFGVVTCRVDSARPLVTEARNKSGEKRVSPDVHALVLELRCETANATVVPTQRALPAETVILLSTPEGKAIAPSTRTWLSEQQPDTLVFEVPAQESFVSPTRRFDAATGQRKTPLHTKVATLLLRTPEQEVKVLLRERSVDDVFERALDALFVSLTQGSAGANALRAAQAMHRAIVEHTGARMIAVDIERVEDNLPRLTLRYDEAADATSSPTLRTLRLALTRGTDAQQLAIESVVDLSILERALRCERERRELRARAAQAYTTRSNTADCHVLGLLVPGPCEAADEALVAHALSVLERCVEPEHLRSKRLPPSDFQLTLRRGRSGSALDRAPRYTLALFAEGQVVFHGRHWVNTLGRNDGRTSPRILGGLYEHMLALDWFERKGGEWSKEGCSTDDDDGNVITLHAAGRERMIVDRAGCRGPFSAQELDGIRVLVEAAAGITSFTRERAAYADPEARIWTVE